MATPCPPPTHPPPSGYKGQPKIRISPSASPFLRAITRLHAPREEPAIEQEGEEEEMVHGTLEVLLVGAKGLENTDYLCTRLSSSFSTFPYFADQLCIGGQFPFCFGYW
jgi:hypothetical protein